MARRRATTAIFAAVTLTLSVLAIGGARGAPTVSELTTTTYTFSTVGTETFTFPAGVTSVTVDLYGAQGGAGQGGGAGGLGAAVLGAVISNPPGGVLQVNVGGKGSDGFAGSALGGLNGGGNGGCCNWAVGSPENGGGGGGASDVRFGPVFSLTDRQAVAGGGGGGGGDNGAGTSGAGGAGGAVGLEGADGTNTDAGDGGTAIAGGVGGGGAAAGGTLGTGGAGQDGSRASGGGGGGGLFGGGGGQGSNIADDGGAGGGGGSSSGSSTIATGVRSGNGLVVIRVSTPDTKIDSGPKKRTKKKSASFTFSSPAGAGTTFQCSLDGAAFTACTSPQDLTGLSRKKHTFQVRAVFGGNTDPTPATYSWKVLRR